MFLHCLQLITGNKIFQVGHLNFIKMNHMKQSFFNLFSSLFRLIRYRKISDPFIAFRHLDISNDDMPNIEHKGIILITPLRVSPTSNIFEGLIGTYFRLKGWDVKYLLCNQLMSFCENVSNEKRKCEICSLCKEEQKQFRSTYLGDFLSLDEIVSNEKKSEIIKYVESLLFDSETDYIYNGVNLRDAIEAGVMRYTQKSEIELYTDLSLLKKCTTTAFILSEAVNILKEKYDIKKLITSHGIYSSWGAVLETAKYFNIDSVVWGRGYIGQGNMLFGNNYAIQEDLKYETEDNFNHVELNDAKRNIVFDYYLAKSSPKKKVDYIDYYEGISLESFDINAFESKVNQYKTVFGMFTNIPWDGQVFNKTDDFPSTRKYIKDTIQWFEKNSDCLLIIRAHPAEVSRDDSIRGWTFEYLLKQEYPTLPDNVIFLAPKNPITSYMALEYIQYAIMYGSSMAIELAVRRIPVIHTGFTYISNKKIVFDVTTLDDYYSKLQMAKEGELIITDEMYDNALRYGYYWIVERNIEDNSCALLNLNFVSYNFKNRKELLSNVFLSFVYNKIVNNKRIVK